ncbi:MAG: DUF1648 domain-containing protein [Candidatus Nanohaloarchaea archaeon]|nr:DUF1648 domain-containing protein [Candidatus Nanohaloarchaea archaeon]
MSLDERQYLILGSLLVLATIAASIVAYPRLPEQVAIHWNAAGQADDHMAKTMGAFLLPGISLLFLVFYRIIPRIDPLRENIAAFRSTFDLLMNVVLGFLLYTNLLVLGANLGYVANVSRFIAPAIGLLLVIVGRLITRSKRNWFIGVRTPWTLSNDQVWDDTHRVTGKLLMAAGFIAMLGFVYPRQLVLLLAAPAAAAAAFGTVYSYVRYRQVDDQ